MKRAWPALLYLAGCAGPAHWVAPEVGAAEGRCTGTQSCSGSDTACLEQMHSDSILCAIDRSRQLARRRPPEQRFDDLAETALRIHCAPASSDSIQALRAALLALLPAVERDIDRVTKEGRVDLAARRATYVARALSSLDLQATIPAELSAAYQRALDFHASEAKRADATFPVAAQYHRCSHYGEGCRSSEAWSPSLTAALSDPFGLTVEARGPVECEDVRTSFPMMADTTFALTQTPVRIELSHCGPLPSRADEKTFRCGQQFAIATAHYERWGYEGSVTVGAETFPFNGTGEVASVERPLTGCDVPTSPFKTAKEATVFAIRSHTLGVVPGIDQSADRMLLVAQKAAREGEVERADAAFALLLDDQPGPEHHEEAVGWFDHRFGAPSTKESYGGASPTSEIGRVADRNWSPPTCH